VEEPAPPARARQQRRLGHAALALTAAAVLAGSLAAGASALTSTADAPTRAAQQSVVKKHNGWAKRDGKCRRGEGHRRSAASVDY
jgi:hypothetical protein